MIWLLPRPLNLSATKQVVSLFESSCVTPFEWGERGWARSQIIILYGWSSIQIVQFSLIRTIKSGGKYPRWIFHSVYCSGWLLGDAQVNSMLSVNGINTDHKKESRCPYIKHGMFYTDFDSVPLIVIGR